MALWDGISPAGGQTAEQDQPMVWHNPSCVLPLATPSVDEAARYSMVDVLAMTVKLTAGMYANSECWPVLGVAGTEMSGGEVRRLVVVDSIY